MILQIISAFLQPFSLQSFLMFQKRTYLLWLSRSYRMVNISFIFKLSNSIIFSNFISALSISIMSRILAKLRKMPISIFLIPGIIPLVPGTGMYKTMYAMLNQNFEEAAFYGAQSLQIAGVIAIAIIFIASFDTLSHKRTE